MRAVDRQSAREEEATPSRTSDPDIRDPLLTIDDVSRLLAVSKATLYTWRSRKRGYGPPALKIGGMLRYRATDVNAWAQSMREAEGAAREVGRAVKNRRAKPRDAGR
jgi:predicted DNA-binding transcriptional regulator AlpA